MLKPRLFWAALHLLSRLPCPDPGTLTPEERGRSALFYPLVGALMGALLALAAWGLGALGLIERAPGLAAALVLSLWVWSSGALHLDGLADTVDAWVGGLGDRERTLRIMKDPTSGPMAIAALVLVLLLKFAAIETLLRSGWLPGLLLPPLLGRLLLLALLMGTPYVRPGGMAADQSAWLPRRAAWVVLMLGALGVTWLAGLAGLILLALAGVLFWWVRRALMARLGGFTGDGAGALIELGETLLIVAAAMLAL
ncbi:MAG: adenosylcobinamide-GDP ribazoletransferase [Chromatiaceae bacterium]|nr:adenosylcobinamide-GDP ribazoletransferase [Chromatiaceae bacterium]